MTKEKIAENSQKLMEMLADLTESELSKLVRLHNKKYFEENKPEITDEAFDKLVETLRFVNKNAAALQEIGQTQASFAKAEFGEEVVHKEPMLSLEKCYDDTSFFKWAEKIASELVVMPKIDGVACSIIYSSQGEITEASTRGDGKVGDNITMNAILISDLPMKLPHDVVKSLLGTDGHLEIRGEVFLPISQFHEKFAKEFVSPRNLAAGLLKLKEGDRSKNENLRFFPYDLRGPQIASEEEKFILLEKLGFSMMPWSVVKNDADATSIYFEMLNKRASYDYEIDGVVFRANSASEQVRLGVTAHHPRYAIAYKFQGESAQTRLLAVEWSVARSGIITPVAIVEPVFVSGASVSRASLHNLGIFLSLDLREDSLVEINRRGGVIPHLERVLSKKGKKIPIPSECPACGGPVEIDGDFLRCKNPEKCEEVIVSRLVHFCHVLGFEGFGEKIVRKLVDAGLVSVFGDIFRLSAESLLSLERMGPVLANKLVEEINRKRKIPLATFIRALGIHEIGSNVSDLVASNFQTLSKIRELSREDLLPIHGIGERIADSLVLGLKHNFSEIEDLLTEVQVLNESASATSADSSHPVYGNSFVFTGKMAHLERKAAQEAVKKLGGKAPEAMSAHVDFLVIGDEGSPLLGGSKKSTKQKTAEKLIKEGANIKIISESEFLKLLSAS